MAPEASIDGFSQISCLFLQEGGTDLSIGIECDTHTGLHLFRGEARERERVKERKREKERKSEREKVRANKRTRQRLTNLKKKKN